MSSTSRKILLGVLAVLVVVFVIYQAHGLFHIGSFSGAKLLDAIRSANLYYLALALTLIYLCYGIRSLRWQVFQRNLGVAHFGAILKMTIAGFGAIFLLGRAGEPARPLLIARKEKLPVADIFGVYILERLFDAASTAVIASIALILFEAHAHTGETAARLEAAARTTGTLLFVGVLGAIALLVYLRLHGSSWLEARLTGWLRVSGWRSSAARILMGFVGGVQTIKSWMDLFLAVFYSALHWFLIVMVYFLVIHSFGGMLGRLSLGDAMLVVAFSLVGSTVQLPAVGGGSQLASFVVLTAIFNVDAESATVAALVLWMITFASASLGGVPLLLHEGFSLGQLREMGKEEKQEEAGVLPHGSTQATLDELERELPQELPAARPAAVRRGDDRE
jgi:glycosyltransferase 2 family protein